ncbi:hypothetical protein [Leifsonia sp. A12D58]|uniref:hypothetical protein n=1 Tax=Leifsonia sp. A12D58 TaxID=3397674 RepID=UPI0039E044A2
MNDDPDDGGPVVAGIRSAVDLAVDRLRAVDAQTEALATYVPSRQVMLVIRKEPALLPVGRVWRLGVFLLDQDGILSATGATTRAVPPGHRGFQSNSAEERRGYRAAAFRGPFAPGETINFDAAAIDLDPEALRTATGPLFVNGGRALVRWNPAATESTSVDFGTYLAERVSLLIDPPERA